MNTPPRFKKRAFLAARRWRCEGARWALGAWKEAALPAALQLSGSGRRCEEDEERTGTHMDKM